MKVGYRSLATLAAVLAVVFGGQAYARAEVEQTEHRMLAQSADDVGLLVNQLISRMETTLAPLHSTALVTEGDPEIFGRTARPDLTAGILAAAVLVDADGRVATVGRPRPADQLDGTARAQLASTVADGGLAFLGLSGSGLGERMAFAYARPGGSGGIAVYGEFPLAALPLLLPPQFLEAGEAGFANLHVAVYSAASPGADGLVFATSPTPLPTPRQVVPIPVGGKTWSLVVAAATPLSSPSERALPWVILGFGVVAAVLVAAVVEVGGRRRRDALAVREERFHLLVQQSSDVVTVVDPETVVLYHTPAAERVFGYSSEELGQRPLAAIVHPDDVACFRDALDLALTEPGQALFVAVRLRHGQGRWLRFEVAGRDLRHEPAVSGIVLNWLDVTEREEARAARSRLASVLEATPDLVVTTDADHRIVFVNSAARRLIGISSGEDLDGRRLVSLFSEGTAAVVGEALDSVRRDGSWMGEMSIASPGGEIPVLSVLVAHRDEDGGAAPYTSLIARDITDRRDLERQLAHQAFHDPLTGLPNRALLNDRLGQALERAKRSMNPAAVLLIDLDDFKTVNDSLGHPAGDVLLRAAAERLGACLRASDTVARLGGDEFAVVLDDATGDSPTLVAERIVTAFSFPFPLQQREVIATASVGVAVVGLVDHVAADEALQAADVALYAAKTGGKARFAVFDPSMLTAAAERLELHVDLRRALEHDELVIHYQPIIEMSTRQVASVEALLRWNHPRHGLLPPDRFISLAEETGLIVDIGRWVLQRSCAQLVEWRAKHAELARLRVSVNVSGRQLEEAGFVGDVAAVLAETGLPPDLLIIEITESVFIQYGPAAELLRELKALGVRLALDDFGTGYSSFSSLQNLPVDVLKIDKSFIDGVSPGPREPTLVAAILRLGEAMGLEVVAEGVEDERQVERLTAMLCPFAQGFFFARPMAAEPAEDLVSSTDPALGGGRTLRPFPGHQLPGELLVQGVHGAHGPPGQ